MMGRRTLLLALLSVLLVACSRVGDVRTVPPTPPPPPLVQLGDYQGQTLYLADESGKLSIWGGARLAELPGKWEGMEFWYERQENYLVLLLNPPELDPGRLLRIDLQSGTVTDLGLLLAPLNKMQLAVSADGRYLGVKHADLPHGLTVIDLASGERLAASDEAQPGGFSWAPEGARWAVRAAAAGSGLPVALSFRWYEGATHVLVGAAGGEVRRLLPPEPLQLLAGPFWSPDGRMLAVASGHVKASGPGVGAEFEQNAAWLVSVETGEWVRLGGLMSGQELTGWPPGGDAYLKGR